MTIDNITVAARQLQEAEITIEEFLQLVQAYIDRATVEARTEENRYYAKLLKISEAMSPDKAVNAHKVKLRKVFEYRLKELNASLKAGTPGKEDGDG